VLPPGANGQSDLGVLFRSKDGGASWSRVKMGVEPKTTVFALALDARQRRMYRATSGGEVFASEDGGESWVEHLLPTAATQVYAMECA